MNAWSWFIAGKMRLMTVSFSKPPTLRWIARKSSAMPPVASLRTSVYRPSWRGSPATDGSHVGAGILSLALPSIGMWCGAHRAPIRALR